MGYFNYNLACFKRKWIIDPEWSFSCSIMDPSEWDTWCGIESPDIHESSQVDGWSTRPPDFGVS